jgi:hypothetical protein
MQVNPQEVSVEKATTPAADLRLVSIEQLKKIHRELDACQKVIWLAGCRPRVPNGFDPAYVTGAQEQLKVIEGLIAQPSGWTQDKPTAPGAYWVRGYRLGEPDSRPALVEVTHNDDGKLLCNLHEHNSNDETHQWSFVADFAERFEWFGPLGVTAESAHLVEAESPGPSFLATVREAKATAVDVFTGCHDDAKQAIEYMAALLEVSGLAKQGGAA